MKFFNTAGPIKRDKHYALPPLERWDLQSILSLIDQEKYFVLHAPRQTGKTSYLLALMDHLNQQGNYYCVYCNVEGAQTARENVKKGIQAVLSEMASRSSLYLKDSLLSDQMTLLLEKHGENTALNEALTRWSSHLDKPLILLVDEIDTLVGDTLISVLRQIRAGYDKRPEAFPQSVILCGVRDVRDYRIHSSHTQEIITGGSAFNIKAESLQLKNFDRTEIQKLYMQHTQATGQAFEDTIVERLWEFTEGQPWLVNALGYEVCFKMKENLDRTQPITLQMMEQAKENLILRRETHLDQLAKQLQEERVRQVILPLLTGAPPPTDIPEDDIHYTQDLGLIQSRPELRIANKIYQEVIPRTLTFSTQVTISHETQWYVDEQGSLNLPKLLTAFQAYFREHSEHWIERFHYKEAGPQLLLQAFLQRIVNGGGRVEREYGLGRMRTDLLVVWPYSNGIQKAVIELKVQHKSLEATIRAGLEQASMYLDRSGTSEGYLLIFDRSPGKTWEEKCFQETRTHGPYTIHVWGM